MKTNADDAWPVDATLAKSSPVEPAHASSANAQFTEHSSQTMPMQLRTADGNSNLRIRIQCIILQHRLQTKQSKQLVDQVWPR